MKRVTSLLARVGVAGATLAMVLGFGLYGATGAPANTAAAAPQKGGVGTIKGRLVWGGAQAPAPEKITSNTQKDPQVCAAEPLYSRALIVNPQNKGIAHAFAYLPAPKGKNPEAEAALLKAKPQVVVDQVNCEFIPYSTAGHEKQEWVFKSSDPVGHNVHYTGFGGNEANFALGPKGEATKDLVASKRPIPLVCDIHPWMDGTLMVFDHPYFAVTGEDGSFEIQGVPAGPQNLVIWQKKAGYVTKGGSRGVAVDVKADAVTDLGEVVLDPAQIK